MRICILTHNFPLTEKDSRDAGVFVKDFAYELHKKGNDIFVFVPDIKGEKGSFKDVKVEWFSWLGGKKKLGDLSLKNPIDAIMLLNLFLAGPIKLEKFIKENDIDELISMWTVPSGYFAYRASKKSGIKYSIWALGSDINKYSKFPVLKLIIRKILKNAKFLFADGIALCEESGRLAGRECIFLPSSRMLPKNIEPARLSSDTINFLFVGRLEEVKGIDVLIKAMMSAFKSGSNCVLYVLGDGSMRKGMEKMVRESETSDNIKFMGNSSPEAVSSFMQACDCLIIPSRSESIPLVLGEAVQFRKPLIVSNAGDMEYIVNKHGIGRVFPSGDSEALKKEILDFACGKFKYSAENFEEICKMFNMDRIAESFDKNYLKAF